MSKIIGIDLGTTNSVVALVEGDTPKVLTNAQGSRLTPSVVAITEKGDRLVGQVARHQQVTNPQNTVHSIKRFMGRRHNEVSSEEKIVAYKVVGGPEELVKVEGRADGETDVLYELELPTLAVELCLGISAHRSGVSHLLSLELAHATSPPDRRRRQTPL